MQDRLGDKLGPRLARVISDAIVDTKRKLADHDSSVIANGIERLLDLMGQEVQPHIIDTLRQVAEHPETTGDAESLLNFVAHHRGEAASSIRLFLSASGVGQGIGTVISASMAPAVQHVLSGLVNGLHDVGTAAQLVAQRIIPLGAGEDEARRQNLSTNRFNDLVQAAYQTLPIDVLLQLVNRGYYPRDGFNIWAERAGLHPDQMEAVWELTRALITPADAADMTVRGIISQDEGRQIAAKSGYTPEDFDKLVLDTGAPLALEQLLLLYRRGQVNDAELEHGIRQSRIRNEWIPFAKELRYAPPSASDAIRAAVQNQLPHDEAIRKFSEAGLNPTEFDWMFNTAGRPPGTQELITLARRGLISIDVVKQAVRESDIKTKYVDIIAEMYEYRPPPRTIVALMRAGTISDSEGLRLLIQQGLKPALAEAYVHEAHKGRTETARHLAQSQILKLYHERAIDVDQTLKMLEGIGWSETDAQFLIMAQDLQREAQALEAALTHVHSLYVGHKTDRSVAVSSLAALGIPQTQAAHLLELWDYERSVNVPTLTRAQVAAAYKWNLLNQDDALAKLQALGYSADDATLILELAVHHPLGGP